jgi:uncharacterized membrane protein HdeD (DUF308 family)
MFTTPTYSRGQAALLGGLATILGIVFVVWPDITIGTAVVLFAVYALVDAVLQLTVVFSGVGTGGSRFLRVLLAILDVTAAAVAVVWPGPTAEVLVIVIGFWAIFSGIAELWGAFTFRSGLLGLTGVLSVVAGIVLIAWPGSGAVSLAIIVGIYLAVYGVMLLVAAAKTPSGARVGDPLTTS